MGDGLRLACTTFTVLPVNGPNRLDRRTAGRAMLCAPLMGALLALPVGAVLVLSRVFTATAGAPLLACVLALGCAAALTRGLHLDGLIDTTDALASYRPPEQARAVAKSAGVGALGVATLALVLGVQGAALLACLQAGRGLSALLTALVVGRLAVLLGCTRTAAAVPTGLGALVACTVGRRDAVLVGALSVAGCAGYAAWATGRGGALQVLLAAAVGLLVAAALRRHAVRRLGGLTGDVLGATLEVSTAVVLLVMACGLPHTVLQVWAAGGQR